MEFADETASYAGRLLADLGTEVIKVEPPGGGRQRHTPPFFRFEGPDTSIAFWVHNTSKKSVVLDLDRASDQALARRLALTADVILEDCPVGFLSSRGLGYEELRALKPALVYASVTGFGQTGPHSAWAYSDIIGQATGGMMILAGDPADPPNLVYGHQADVSASINAAQGTLLAVLHAESTGQGQHVDVSAQEAVSMNQETAMQNWDLQHKNRVRMGGTTALPITVPGYGLYEASDGGFCYFMVPAAGAGFPGLVQWMRDEGAVSDLDTEPYASLCATLNLRFLAQALADPAAAGPILGQLSHIQEAVARFAGSRTANELYEQGQARRLLIGLVSTPADLAHNRHLREREWFQQLQFDYLGASVEFPGAPYRLSETPALIARPPALGEHTDAILASLGIGGVT